MDRATEPPNRNVLLRNEAIVDLKDFNSVDSLGLTLPSSMIDASPIVAAAGPWVLRCQKKPLLEWEGLKGIQLEVMDPLITRQPGRQLRCAQQLHRWGSDGWLFCQA